MLCGIQVPKASVFSAFITVFGFAYSTYKTIFNLWLHLERKHVKPFMFYPTKLRKNSLNEGYCREHVSGSMFTNYFTFNLL